MLTGTATGGTVSRRPRRPFARNVREAALLRAKYRCEECGDYRSALELHHRGGRYDASGFNAVVLCLRCHRGEHARRDLRNGGRPFAFG
jgi:5-methylcytosine-specific restriction endonuclease McrA